MASKTGTQAVKHGMEIGMLKTLEFDRHMILKRFLNCIHLN
jgi:hypothetical protein